MTHEYKVTAPPRCSPVPTCSTARCNVKRHCHQEFIRFLNTIEAQVPERKVIHAIVDNYAFHKHPKGARMACSASALDFSLHPDFRILAQCGRRLFLLNLAATSAWCLPIRRRPQGRHPPLWSPKPMPIPGRGRLKPPIPAAPSPLSNAETSVRVGPPGP
jgi:hypothetical protein